MEIKFDQGTYLVNVKSEIRSSKELVSELQKNFGMVWDSRVQLFRVLANKKTDFIKYLESIDIKIKIIVNPKKINFIQFNNNLKWNSEIQLRDYQKDAALNWIKNNNRGIVILPTGA